MRVEIKNYCVECKRVATADCEAHGHLIGTFGKDAPDPEENESGEHKEEESLR